MKFQRNAIAPALVFVAVVTIAGLAGCAAVEYPSPRTESFVESTQPAYKTTSAALASTGSAYLGLVVELTGTIEHIVNKGGQPAVVLSGQVICGFGEKQKPMVQALRVGDLITLRGVYVSRPANSNQGPYLTPCIRVP